MLMVEYLSEKQVLVLHRAIIGARDHQAATTEDVVRLFLDFLANPVKMDEVRDRDRLQSALGRPAVTYDGRDLSMSQLRKKPLP